MDETAQQAHQASISIQVQQAQRPSLANAIPFEIIEHILLQLLSDCDIPYNSDTAPMLAQARRDIVSASQISLYWRSVAGQLPMLWATILNVDTASIQWVKQLLLRSKNLPLKIQSDASLDKSSVFVNSGYRSGKWKLIFKEMDRIRVLHLVLHRQGKHSVTPLMQALIQSAPLMESLQVLSDAHSFGGIADKLLKTWPADRLFNGTAPKLRELVVRGMGLWKISQIPSVQLTSLSLSYITGERSLSSPEWLDMLDAQPQLSYLRIEASPRQHYDATTPDRQVNLPHLKFLKISGRQEFINHLFPRIMVPKHHVLQLTSYRSVWDLPVANAGITKGLEQYFQSAKIGLEHDSPCRVWRICWLSGRQLTIDVFAPTFADPILSLSLYLSTSREDPTLTAVFDLLRSKGVMNGSDALQLKFDVPLSQDAMPGFISLLHSCHKMSRLVLMGAFTVTTILKYVSLYWEQTSSQPLSSRTLFPNLQVLIYNEAEDEFQVIRNMVFNFLSWRSAIGCKIPRFWMCLQQHERMAALIKKNPNTVPTSPNQSAVSLTVSKSQKWDVVERTPFPIIF